MHTFSSVQLKLVSFLFTRVCVCVYVSLNKVSFHQQSFSTIYTKLHLNNPMIKMKSKLEYTFNLKLEVTK